MNELRKFTNAEFGSIRAVTINGEPYFVGNCNPKVGKRDLRNSK